MSRLHLAALVCILLPMTAGAQQAPAPKLTFAFEVRATVGAPLELGQVAQGRRRIIPITGGTFEGPNLRGKVMNGGADWQIIRADGREEIYGKVSRLLVKRGDLVRLVTGTGGGWGDPREREPARVLADLRDGFISAETARDVFGVEPHAAG